MRWKKKIPNRLNALEVYSDSNLTYSIFFSFSLTLSLLRGLIWNEPDLAVENGWTCIVLILNYSKSWGGERLKWMWNEQIDINQVADKIFSFQERRRPNKEEKNNVLVQEQRDTCIENVTKSISKIRQFAAGCSGSLD